jgi:hypothetical protein
VSSLIFPFSPLLINSWLDPPRTSAKKDSLSDGALGVKVCSIGVEVEVGRGGGVEDIAEDMDGTRLVARELVQLFEAGGLFLYRSTNAEVVPDNARDLHSSAAVNISVSFDVNLHVIGKSTY